MKTILLVEDDKLQMRIWAEAFAEAGFFVLTERDGEWALQTFLQRPVDLVVMDCLLPVMNGFQVAERLRATDKGRDVPLILVSGVYRSARNRPDTVARFKVLEYFDKPLEPSRLVEFIQSYFGAEAMRAQEARKEAERKLDRIPEGALAAPRDVEESQEVERVSRSSEFRVLGALHGDFKERPFPEVLAELWRWKAAGALLLKRGQVKKIVYFRDGYPILVKSNLLSECLGRVLVRERMITEAECETSLKKMKESQKQQGTVLIEMGCISPHNLTYGLQLQLEAKLYEVFAWTDGEFRFNPRSDVATPTTGLDLPAARIIYEGVRRSYDEARLKKALGDVEALPVARSTDPLYRFQDIGMDGEETELWHRIDGRRTVKELVAGGPLEREDALKFLYALLCVQMVEIAPEAQLVEEEEPEEAEEAPGGEPVPTPPSLELEERLARERLLARLQDLKRQTYFEVLGIAPAAAGTGVRKAFFALAKEHHPDRYAARSPEVRAIAGEIFALLTTAHDTLTDAEARKRYEEELKRAPPESDADRASRILAADREFRRGEGLLEAHLAQDAMEAFEKAVSLYPEEAEFHAFLGWAVHLARREDAEQAQRALGHLSKAVELNPRLDRGHLFLSRVHRALGHATEAEAALERALQANPDSAEAQRELRGSAPTAGP